MATIKAKAARLNIVIEQGADLDKTLTWKDSAGVPIDLTGFSAEMDIRDSQPDPITLYELSTVNGRIVLGGAAGTIQLLIPAADSEAFTWTSGVYDFELTDTSSKVRRLFKGTITIDPEVTRP